jgi:serine protease
MVSWLSAGTYGDDGTTARMPDASDPALCRLAEINNLRGAWYRRCRSTSAIVGVTRVSSLIIASNNGPEREAWPGASDPVRVLGKCGGYDSDIAARHEMGNRHRRARPATNPNPAKVY